jgi:hypothetical protein
MISESTVNSVRGMCTDPNVDWSDSPVAEIYVHKRKLEEGKFY